MDCSSFQKQRHDLLESIEKLYVKHITPVWERTIDPETLIAPTHTNKQTCIDVKSAFIAYIDSLKIDF